MIRQLFLLASLFCSCVYIANAQDELDAEAAAETPPPPPADPAKKPGPREPITDPVVLTILESNPQTPIEQFEAAWMLARLGEPELAQPLLKKLIDARLDDAALAALADKFGTPVFLKFAKIEALAPEAGEFAETVLAAASKFIRDPQRLEQFVAQLSSDDEIEREDAILALRRAGSSAVGPLFAALYDQNSANQRAAIQQMILELDSDAIGPLKSATASPRPEQQAKAIELLGLLRTRDALPLLVAAHASRQADPDVVAAAGESLQRITGRTPGEQESQAYLEHYIQHQLKDARLSDRQDTYGAEPPTGELWQWQADAGPQLSIVPVANIARANAARVAQLLFQLDAADRGRTERYIAAVLEEAKHRVGLDVALDPATLDEVAAVDRPDIVVQVLVDALAADNTAVATGAAEVLGETGSLTLLESAGGRPAPLVMAARSGDRRVRSAAIQAIVKLRPTTPFAGASAVSDGLTFLALSRGHRRALVAHPKSGTAQQWAGYLSGLGYEVDIATNGRDAFKLATSSPDYELAFVHTALDHPRADDLLTQLRKDPRTAKLPVGLIAIPDRPETAERLANGVPMTHAFAEPQVAADLQFQAKRLLSMPGCRPIPPEIRKQHAAAAIRQLADYAEHPVAWLDARSISVALERSLYSPDVTGAVASLLGSAGTATGQSELVQMAARESLPLARREAAALAFARSVVKHGILLKSDQILAQYDRYNANAGRNPDTHKVMSIVLAALESKARGMN